MLLPNGPMPKIFLKTYLIGWFITYETSLKFYETNNIIFLFWVIQLVLFIIYL